MKNQNDLNLCSINFKHCIKHFKCLKQSAFQEILGGEVDERVVDSFETSVKAFYEDNIKKSSLFTVYRRITKTQKNKLYTLLCNRIFIFLLKKKKEETFRDIEKQFIRLVRGETLLQSL